MEPSRHRHRNLLRPVLPSLRSLPLPSFRTSALLAWLSFPRLKNRTVKADLKKLLHVSEYLISGGVYAAATRLSRACSSSRPISIGKLPHCCAFTADLSPDRLSGVFCIAAWNLLLEVGFTLRCLQRLSAPHFASQLCRWHDNCCTRDASTPVLSY